MARTAITVTTTTRTGVAQPSQQNSDLTNGMKIDAHDGKVIFELNNTDAATQTVGFAFGQSIDGSTPADKTVSLTTGQTKIAGPFPTNYYNQADGALYVNPSVNTNIKIRAYKLP
jgi:hypothetical protein